MMQLEGEGGEGESAAGATAWLTLDLIAALCGALILLVLADPLSNLVPIFERLFGFHFDPFDLWRAAKRVLGFH